MEKAMAPLSRILAWKIPWAEEPGVLQSTGLRRELPLSTSGSATAAITVAFGRFVAWIPFLFAPKFFLFHFGTLDPPFAHLLVMLYLSLRKFAVFSENDIEAEEKYAQSCEDKCQYNQFHISYGIL